jgi:acetyl esterase/lipase
MTYNFDPELAGIIPALPQMPFDDPVAARAGIEALSAAMNTGVDLSGLHVIDKEIPGPAQAPVVKVRIYTPSPHATQPSAALIYIHGGGFVVGSIDTEHASAAMLARKLGIVVVSVEYRLAPEHPYPAGLDDCYATLCWLHENAATLQIDRARIGVFGQSAGGGLAAALALFTRDQQGPALCFQFLGIPELDDRLDTPSMVAFTDTPLWHRPNAIMSWQYYLGVNYQAGGANVPAYAAPARATDLRDLPPAYVSAMEFDPLRDEDVIYALKLLQAGVSVELHTYPGTFHGSSLITQAAVSKRQQQEMLDVLRRGLRIGNTN